MFKMVLIFAIRVLFDSFCDNV